MTFEHLGNMISDAITKAICKAILESRARKILDDGDLGKTIEYEFTTSDKKQVSVKVSFSDTNAERNLDSELAEQT
jgi:hypothetical protein